MNAQRTLVLTLCCLAIALTSTDVFAQMDAPTGGGLLSIDVSVNSRHPYDVEEAMALEIAYNNLRRQFPNRCFFSPADPTLDPKIVDSYITYLQGEDGKPFPRIIHVWRVFYYWEPC